VSTSDVLALGGFALSGIVAFAVTPFTAKLARRFGILDLPTAHGYKKHTEAIPYLGGVAIYAGLAAAALGGLAFREVRDVHLTQGFPLAFLLALALGIVGLVDDVRHLPRLVRLGAQLLAAYIAYEGGFAVQVAGWEWLNVTLTLVWVVGITNAFNLLDNMDGLTAGVAAVAGISFAVMAALGDLSGPTVASAAVAGASIGFLVHNRHPARVFMGDAGSTFLGFILALIGITLEFDNLVKVTFLVPVVALGIPIFDTTLVVLSRLKHGRDVFKGARDHVSHRLVAIGIPVRAAVALLYFAGLCLGWLALVISRADVEVGWMLLVFVFVVAIFCGFLLWRVPVYEADLGPPTEPDEAGGEPEPAHAPAGSVTPPP
jgi:UDP-GlcNAc:undecaprenyl-phosphate GlcNAc-1-phosphate transferase